MRAEILDLDLSALVGGGLGDVDFVVEADGVGEDWRLRPLPLAGGPVGEHFVRSVGLQAQPKRGAREQGVELVRLECGGALGAEPVGQ